LPYRGRPRRRPPPHRDAPPPTTARPDPRTLVLFGVGDVCTPGGIRFAGSRVGAFPHRQVRHEVVRRGAIPVPLTGWGVDVSPGRITTTTPPPDCTSPIPSVTCRVCPQAWLCQAVRAHGANRTVLTRILEGSSPLAMTSKYLGDDVKVDVAGEQHPGRPPGGSTAAVRNRVHRCQPSVSDRAGMIFSVAARAGRAGDAGG
jgi:hypothetical protein